MICQNVTPTLKLLVECIPNLAWHGCISYHALEPVNPKKRLAYCKHYQQNHQFKSCRLTLSCFCHCGSSSLSIPTHKWTMMKHTNLNLIVTQWLCTWLCTSLPTSVILPPRISILTTGCKDTSCVTVEHCEIEPLGFQRMGSLWEASPADLLSRYRSMSCSCLFSMFTCLYLAFHTLSL